MTLEILIIFLILFVSHSIFLAIVLHNLANAPKLERKNLKSDFQKKISVLIPARNEEKSIDKLLSSLLTQSAPLHEIIVLDDNSDDRTAEIVNKYSAVNENIQLLHGSPLPENWLGKNWACHQLSKEAAGNFLLFIDADVELHKNAVSGALKVFSDKQVSMLSVFPSQIIGSFGEWLVVPLMNWLLLNFLPLRTVLTSKRKNFAAANGQFILIDKKAYFNIGGHESVRDHVVEDMELAKLIKSSGRKIITCLGNNVINARMYQSFDDAVNGFSKNFYAGFGVSKPVFLLLITIFLVLFISPIFLLLVNYIFFLIILVIALERIFISILSNQNWLINLLLHVIQIPVMYYIGLKSLFKKSIVWKGRSI